MSASSGSLDRPIILQAIPRREVSMNVSSMIGVLNGNAGLLIDAILVCAVLGVCAAVAAASLWGARTWRLERLLSARAGRFGAIASVVGLCVGLVAGGAITGVLRLPLEAWMGSAVCAAVLLSFVFIGVGSSGAGRAGVKAESSTERRQGGIADSAFARRRAA